MPRAVDHAVFTWDELEDITAVLTDVGLAPDYGGEHADGTTEMALVGFDDGSYLELIAATAGEDPPVRWPEGIADAAGPYSWCLGVEDVRQELVRLIHAGIAVSGPERGSRERPDGTLVEYDSAVYGTAESIGRLPFLVEDRTPRRYRVQPSESVTGGPLTGVANVVVAVADADAASEQFQRLHSYPSPRYSVQESFGARLASFPGRPVILAEPLEESTDLARRLERHGTRPCAVLLGTADAGRTRAEYPLTDANDWFDATVRWFERTELDRRLGVIER